MFQIRGLGAIPSSAYGAGGGPVVVAPNTIDVPYAQPPTMYPGTPPPPSGGTPPYQPPLLFQSIPKTYVQPAPVVYPPVPDPLPPPPVVTPQLPVATNPANPTEPAPSGTQVYVAPPAWNAAWYKGGMSPRLWGIAVLLLALGIGGYAVYRSRR